MSDATVPIPMPHLGVSVTEGTVIAWHKAAGDTVEVDELVCEISTDKVDTEVLAPAAGVIARLVAAEGETVAVGEPLAELALSSEAAAALTPTDPAPAAEADREPAAAPAEPTPDAPPPAPVPRRPATAQPKKFDPVAAAEALLPAGASNGAPACSPVARRVASEHGIDLGVVTGSGSRGRIRKADVLAAVEARAAAPHAPAVADLLRGYDDVPRELVPLSRQRSLMAEHMIRSRQTAAHMTTEAEVDMSAVDRARTELNERRLAAQQRRLTALAFIARAACTALGEFPDLNATFDGKQLIRWRQVNLGIAVDTERGLIVPVIRGAEGLTAAAIGDAIAELAGLARSRKLSPDHVRAGTFTISNPGSVGGVSAMAIINQPQVAILGTPAIVRRPVVVADADGRDAVAIRPVMSLALTFDHRVIDGAYATRYVVRIKELLETVEGHSEAR